MAAILEFRNALKKHDWYYEFSDDGDVYRRGQKQRQAISRLEAKTLEEGVSPKDVIEIWNYFAPKNFKRDPVA